MTLEQRNARTCDECPCNGCYDCGECTGYLSEDDK